MVIALTDSKRLFALANARGENIPMPWDGFREQAEHVVLSISVSHRVQRSLHGPLHEDTFYGATQKGVKTETANTANRPWAKGWIEGGRVFVRRKTLADIKNPKTQDLRKVRDDTIREILRSHLLARGIDPDKPGELPSNIFKGENTPRMPSGVPIKRVRMVEASEMMRPVSEKRGYQFIEPGRNHHMVVFDVLDENGAPLLDRNGQPKRDGKVVPMLDVANRIRDLET